MRGRFIISGLVILALGLVFHLLKFSPVFTVTFIITGVVTVIITSYYATRGERMIQDERTRRVSALSLSYSWFATYLLIAALIWVHLLIIPLTVPLTLLIIMLFMAFSNLLFKWHFNRRSDLE